MTADLGTTTPGGYLLVLAILLPLSGIILSFTPGGRSAERVALCSTPLGFALACAIAFHVGQAGKPIAYVIGGLTPDTRNLISGNQLDGLHFQTGFQGGASDGMRIQGNLIGTTASGLAPLVNGTVAVGGRGIVLVTGGGGAQNILVGGTNPNARNVIVGVSSDTAMYIEQYTASGPGFLGSRVEGNLLGLAEIGRAHV